MLVSVDGLSIRGWLVEVQDCDAAADLTINQETDMMTRRFKARIKLPHGTTEVVIESDGIYNAKQMLEAQYGPGTVIWGPVEVLGNG